MVKKIAESKGEYDRIESEKQTVLREFEQFRAKTVKNMAADLLDLVDDSEFCFFWEKWRPIPGRLSWPSWHVEGWWFLGNPEDSTF